MPEAVYELPIIDKFDGQLARWTREPNTGTHTRSTRDVCRVSSVSKFSQNLLAKLGVPTSTDERIDAICNRIRELCCDPLSPEDEAEIRHLAMELRGVINEHVRLAKSSLGTKQSAITVRDPEAA